MDTEIIDKLFLELSQFTTATTRKEMDALLAIHRTHGALSAAGVRENGEPCDRVRVLAEERDELIAHRNKLVKAAREAQELLKFGSAYEALERAIKNE